MGNKQADPAQVIASANPDIFYIRGNSQNSNGNMGATNILAFAMKRLPPERAKSYAHLILDRASWLSNTDTPFPKVEPASKKSGGIATDGQSKLVLRALRLHDEALALRLVNNGAPISEYHLHVAAENGLNTFVTFALDNLCNPENYVALYKNGSAVEKNLTLQSLTKKSPAEAAPIVSAIIKQSDIRDFLYDVVRRTIVPAYLLTKHGSQALTSTPSNNESGRLNVELLRALLRIETEAGRTPVDLLKKLHQLSYSWHHPELAFPRVDYTSPAEFKLPPFMERIWHPIVNTPFVTKNGYTIHNLTSESELTLESQQLGHCVYSYTNRCCIENSSRSHIFSIRSAEGEHLSTFDLRAENDELRVSRHEGKKIKNVASYITEGPPHEALNEFLSACRSKKLAVETRQLGETEESKKLTSLAAFIKNCGYYPAWENVDRTFQEFKKDLRRGASAVDDNNLLVYDTAVGNDGIPCPIHLVDGTVVIDGGRTLQLRNMNMQEWLRATGLMKAMCEMAGKEFEEKPLTATLPPPLTPAQRVVRDAYAHNTGVLDRGDVRHLGVVQKARYEGRLRDLNPRKDADYFARST